MGDMSARVPMVIYYFAIGGQLFLSQTPNFHPQFRVKGHGVTGKGAVLSQHLSASSKTIPGRAHRVQLFGPVDVVFQSVRRDEHNSAVKLRPINTVAQDDKKGALICPRQIV
jgi:hypothetical protein